MGAAFGAYAFLYINPGAGAATGSILASLYADKYAQEFDDFYADFFDSLNEHLNDYLYGDLPNITMDSITVSESDKIATVSIKLDKPLDKDVILDVSTHNGSATAGKDYIASSRTITIPAGQTQYNYDIEIISDKEIEGDEYFGVSATLVNKSDFDTGTTYEEYGVDYMKYTTVKIQDDDTDTLSLQIKMLFVMKQMEK